MVMPVTLTRSQSVKRTRCVRRRSCLRGSATKSSNDFNPDGYHRLPSSLTVPPLERKAFHSTSLTLERFTGRHQAPFPSMIPSPEILTSCRLEADMPGRILPSLSLCTNLSGDSRITAPRSRCRSMQSLRTMGPVIYKPAGTTRWPPPCFCRADTAFSNATVLSALPSATAPKSMIFTRVSGICTGAGATWAYIQAGTTSARRSRNRFILQSLFWQIYYRFFCFGKDFAFLRRSFFA